MSRACLSLLLGSAVIVAACSNSSSNNGPAGGGGTGSAQLAIVNGLAAGSGTQVKLDQTLVTLAGAGQVSHLAISSGAHQLDVTSSGGHSYGSLSFSVAPDSTQTVVVSGAADTAIVSVAVDSNVSPETGQGVPLTGHILLVNSAPNVGPFDVYVYRANSDSTLHFGSFSFGAGTAQSTSPYRFMFPFNPGTYTFDVVNPGSTTPLASAVVTLATGDAWTVVLTNANGGALALAATKQ